MRATRSTTLLKLGAIPVINENDTVATAEIRYGDNDRLGARVAQMASADCLVLLSDVDGLYSADPTRSPVRGLHSRRFRGLTPEIEAMAGGVGDRTLGSGGMITKVAGREDLHERGLCHLCVASRPPAVPAAGASRREHAAPGSCRGARRRQARKQWIAGHAGARRATVTWTKAPRRPCAQAAACCRPAVVRVSGRVPGGDAVMVRDPGGPGPGAGPVAYASDETRRMPCGRRSEELEGMLGYSGRDEIDPSRRPGPAGC